MRKILIITSLISLLIHTGCGSSKSTAYSKNSGANNSETGYSKPSWVNNRPTDPQYYIGIAMASKSVNPTSYAMVAQRNALNEIASQIEVHVKSNSMLFSFDENSGHEEEYKEFIQVKANQQIENYEEVDVYENSTQYWVYYRLSIEQFKRDKREKIEKAMDLSLQSVKVADNHLKVGDIQKSIQGYFKALIPLKPYLGENLKVEYQQREIYLGNYILEGLDQASSRLLVSPKSSMVNTHWGTSVPLDDLSFTVSSTDGNVQDEINIRFNYSEGLIRPREAVSNINGEVSTEIKNISSKKSIQNVEAWVDFEEMVFSKRPDEISKLILKRMHHPMGKVELKVVAPKVFIHAKTKSSALLADALNTGLLNKGFEEVSRESNADLKVSVSSESHHLGETNGYYTISMEVITEIIDLRNGKVIYQDKQKAIKGVGKNYSDAVRSAREKVAEDLEKKIAPRFYRNYLN